MSASSSTTGRQYELELGAEFQLGKRFGLRVSARELYPDLRNFSAKPHMTALALGVVIGL